MDKKDYYAILGFTEDEKKLQGEEFKKVLKKKFKKKAIEFHPDRFSDEKEKKDAEAKFKEINEANEILSDDKKRAEYDSPSPFKGNGFAGFNGFGGDMGMDDIISQFRNHNGFNPFNRSNAKNNAPKKGTSLQGNIPLTLEEMFSGIKKTIKINVLRPCNTCKGSGLGANGHIGSCDECGGVGQVYKTIKQGYTTMSQIFTCSSCRGTGKKVVNPCTKCGGNGVERVAEEIEIDFPKGCAEGMQLTLNGKGNSPIRSEGINGDLIINIIEQPHDTFRRIDNNLLFQININVLDAILGCTKKVVTIDGKELEYNVPQGVEDGFKMRFKGYGMPSVNNNNERGDMYGIVAISMPKSLTDEEKNILNSLKDKPHFKS